MDDQNDDAQSLTGVWHGRYSYPGTRMPENSFVAVLYGSTSLTGTVHEVMRHGDGSESPANATVVGACHGHDVTFLKSYDGTSHIRHNVMYAGLLSQDRLEIEGVWRIQHPGGVFSGRFLMIRKRGDDEAVTREVAETVSA